MSSPNRKSTRNILSPTRNIIPVQRVTGMELERAIEKYGDISPSTASILRYFHAMYGPRKLDILEFLLDFLEAERGKIELAVEREIWTCLARRV